jgi:Pregnancy-associated plasma protein-A
MKAFLALFAVALLSTPSVQAEILWRVSIKQIIHPITGVSACTDWATRADAERAIDEANAILDATGRGARLVLTDYTPVPNANNFAMLTPTPENVGIIEDYALANNYGWRSDALNVYLTQAAGGFIGYCSFPGDQRSTIILACTGGRPRGQLLLHEIGHFFDLAHTFNGSTCCDRTTTPTCSHTFSANGILSDLIPDLNCDFPNEIATNRFGRVVAQLNAEELALFNVTYRNLMTYHPVTVELSGQQNDIMAITANTVRANAVQGHTRFVSNFGFVFGAGSRTASSLPTVAQAVTEATSGDAVVIFAGNYNEPQTITKALTIQATRGPVTIGPP